MLGLVITIKDGYIGPHFVHRLTPTNITSKLMKIPNKIAQLLNLDSEGVAGLCMGVAEVMQVGYHIDRDGRMVFDKIGVFLQPRTTSRWTMLLCSTSSRAMHRASA